MGAERKCFYFLLSRLNNLTIISQFNKSQVYNKNYWFLLIEGKHCVCTLRCLNLLPSVTVLPFKPKIAAFVLGKTIIISPFWSTQFIHLISSPPFFKNLYLCFVFYFLVFIFGCWLPAFSSLWELLLPSMSACKFQSLKKTVCIHRVK